MFRLVKSYQGQRPFATGGRRREVAAKRVRRNRPVSKPRLVIKVRVVSPSEMNAE
jgi:hypothetical protein